MTTENNHNTSHQSTGINSNPGAQKHSKAASKTRIDKMLAFILGGEFLTNKSTLRLIPFIAYVCLLLTLSISLRYQLEHLSKDKINKEEQIVFLREIHIQNQQKYQELTKISEVASMLDTIGVGIIAGPPHVIIKD